MIALVILIHIVACLFLIGVVLLQQGKGADLAGAFGGGTQTVFGARGTVTVLHKLTTFGFVLFIVTSVFLGVAQRRGTESSVMKGMKTAPAKSAPLGSAPAPGPSSQKSAPIPARQTPAPATQQAPAPQAPAAPAPAQPKAK